MDVFYLCDGCKCAGVDCKGARRNGIYATPQLYFDNVKQTRWCTDCYLTSDVSHAKNGPIKGPIDLIKRFRIHLKPYVYLEEKE